MADSTLTPLEQEQLDQAQEFIELMGCKGWNRMVNLLNSLSMSKYPNPTSSKYKWFPWENMMRDYTYAFGATSVVKELLQVMNQQENIFNKLKKRKDGTEEIYGQI